MGRFREEPEDPGGFIAPGGAGRVRSSPGPQDPVGLGNFSRLSSFMVLNTSSNKTKYFSRWRKTSCKNLKLV